MEILDPKMRLQENAVNFFFLFLLLPAHGPSVGSDGLSRLVRNSRLASCYITVGYNYTALLSCFEIIVHQQRLLVFADGNELIFHLYVFVLPPPNPSLPFCF